MNVTCEYVSVGVKGWLRSCQEFFSNFGGNVFLCENVVDNLRSKFRMGEESLFDPFDVRGNEGLIGLVKDPLTRQHMVNMAQQGWSAIEEASAEEETPSQQAARIIAKKNFGAVIGRKLPPSLTHP